MQNIDATELPANKEKVIILSYMVTTYQLLSLAALRDLQAFNQKSCIEAIVEGNPVKITLNHVKMIKEKLELLKIL